VNVVVEDGVVGVLLLPHAVSVSVNATVHARFDIWNYPAHLFAKVCAVVNQLKGLEKSAEWKICGPQLTSRPS